jgi:hypothetical protein
MFVDDAVPQWILYCVCGHKKNDGTMGLGNSCATTLQPGSGTFGLSALPRHEKNIFMPSDSNHMMSSLRCKHGCVVRIPPSIDRVLRNGFPA